MGKTLGFLEYARQDPEYRSPAERLADYRSVATAPDRNLIMEQAARCMDCGTPFCHGTGCPLGNLVPEFNDLIWHERWEEALALLRHGNPFADITSRVCPAPCESACVLGIADQPVAIRTIEAALIEWGYAENIIRPSPPSQRHPLRIAVIGSGPAGMAAAHRLNQLGYNIVVYEHAKLPGGILRYGIPEFKLEKRILDRRIDLMRREGIVFECGVCIGKDLSYRYLAGRYQAVCMAFGAREPRDLNIPGRELKGIHFAMEYLSAQNRRLLGEPEDENLSATGREVVIIGGGDTGADCLGTALRQRARRVTQLEILPEPSVTRPAHTPWPEWPDILRVSTSHEEGGERRWSIATRAFIPGKNSDRVGELDCARVEWMTENGKRRPREIPGSAHRIPADFVLLALGFTGIAGDTILPPEFAHLLHQKDQITSVNRDHSGERTPAMYIAGDAASGPSLVVKAFADGIRTADRIAVDLAGS